MSLPMLTLWQPWASLMALGVKTIETRSWPAPKSLIGQRMGIHAAKREVSFDDAPLLMLTWEAQKQTGVGCDRCGHHRDMHVCHFAYTRCIVGPCVCDSWYAPPLPLGAIVATGVLADCVPMVDGIGPWQRDCLSITSAGELWLARGIGQLRRDVSDQLPYGDYRPGRWAWLYEDVKPTTERCPACWGVGHVHYWVDIDDTGWATDWIKATENCLTCEGAGHCEPIPAKGRQGIWRWAP